MSGYLICLLAFASVFGAGMLNWRWSLCLMIAWGYFYGILKAHLVYSGGHFIFDAATLGFYAGLVTKPPTQQEMSPGSDLKPWIIILTFWPVFMAIIPLQHYLIQLVGLRGNILWLPMILVGSWVDRIALVRLATTLSIMNCISFAVALGEYTLGVEFFVPENEVTQIVFRSGDIVSQSGEKTLRIPSIFANAHSYAGTMVLTICLILGCLTSSRVVGWFGKPLYLAGLFSAFMGVFIAGPRMPVAVLGILLAVRLASGKISASFIIVTVVLVTGVLYLVMQNDRMQRFLELQDIDMVGKRISGSVNMRFFDVVEQYPMGRGMGAGGTSIPFFLQHHLPEGTGMTLESEIGRIVLEQGLPGLIILLAFLSYWMLRPLRKDDPLFSSKALLWANASVWATTMLIGCGAFATIPGTALMLISLGFLFARVENRESLKFRRLEGHFANVQSNQLSGMGSYQRGLARA